MVKFTKIGFGTPLQERVLLFWKESQHIEDGQLIWNADGATFTHILFDGQCMDDEPTHWMYLPEVIG